MDFQLSEEQKELRDSVRRYARERLAGVAEEIEQSAEPPTRELEERRHPRLDGARATAARAV